MLLTGRPRRCRAAGHWNAGCFVLRKVICELRAFWRYWHLYSDPAWVESLEVRQFSWALSV